MAFKSHSQRKAVMAKLSHYRPTRHTVLRTADKVDTVNYHTLPSSHQQKILKHARAHVVKHHEQQLGRKLKPTEKKSLFQRVRRYFDTHPAMRYATKSGAIIASGFVGGPILIPAGILAGIVTEGYGVTRKGRRL